MKFKYIESCEAGFVELRGVVFKEGEAVEVDDQELQKKLADNSHFQVVKPRAKKNASSED